MQAHHNTGTARLNPFSRCKGVYSKAGFKDIQSLADREYDQHNERPGRGYHPAPEGTPRLYIAPDAPPLQQENPPTRERGGLIDCIILLAVAFMAGITLRELTDVQAVYWLVGGMGVSIGALLINIIARKVTQ